VSVCSCIPATTLDSQDESLTGFVQQSHLRGKTPDEIATDPAMQEAMSGFLNSVTNIVGAERAPGTLTQIMGTMLLHYISGGSWTADVSNLRSES